MSTPAGQELDLEDLSTAFNAFTGQRYNAARPFVVVDIGGEAPTRGDVHGYLGVARVLAEKAGARLAVIDSAALLERYPGESLPHNLLKRYFEEEGDPDFYFSTITFETTLEVLLARKRGQGVIVSSYNEKLPSTLIPKWRHGDHLIPHHLTPETLAREGARFKETFASLPRPLIGINFVGVSPHIFDPIENFVEKIAQAALAAGQGTLFVLSCHRTRDSDYEVFMSALGATFTGREDRFRVIGVNFNQAKREDPGFWNPYQGMLHEADHIVQIGDSGSMLSEALAAGKTPYCSRINVSRDAFASGYVKDLFQHAAGKVFETSGPVALPDVTTLCALGLLKKRQALLREIELRPRRPYENLTLL